MMSNPPVVAMAPADIIVTGKALSDAQGEALLSVTVIGEERLRSAPGNRLEQVLQGVPGLQLFRRSDASSAHPSSQGLTLRALGGNASTRALLLLDGVPQVDLFGGWVNWPALPVAGIDRVRVTRGGGSVAFGPGALAGVVELTSASEDGTTGDIAAGSRQGVEGSIGLGTSLGGGQLQLNVAAARGEGFIPVVRSQRGAADRAAAYANASSRLRWTAPLWDSAELQIGGGLFLDQRERGLRYTANRSTGQDLSARIVGRGRWQWSALLFGQRRDFRSSFASATAGRQEARRVSLQHDVPGRAVGWSLEVRPAIGEGQLRVGVDGRWTSGRSEEFSNYVAGQPTRERVSGGETLTTGGFAELTRSLGRLTLSGAARIDRWTIADGQLEERILATGAPTIADDYPNRSGWRPTARIAAGLDLSSGWELRSAIYGGWRLPTLNELFRPFRAGADATAANPALEPERLRGAEIGVTFGGRQLSLSATAFVNRLRDPVANVTRGFGPGLFPRVGFVGAGGTYRQRDNLDAIVSKGVEAEGEWRSGAWSLSAGLSYVTAVVRAVGTTVELDGLRPAQTPRFSGSLEAGWDRRGHSFALSLRHVGAQYEHDLNLRQLRSATTIGAFGALPLKGRWQLIGRGENLFDARVIAGISGDGTIERATPRTLWIGLRHGGGDRRRDR